MARWPSSDPNGCDHHNGSYVCSDQQKGNTSLLRHCGVLENARSPFPSGRKPFLLNDPEEESGIGQYNCSAPADRCPVSCQAVAPFGQLTPVYAQHDTLRYGRVLGCVVLLSS